MIEVIAEHSVDTALLKGGICIDVGCRGFKFSEAMRDLGCRVRAFDLEYMDAPKDIRFYKAAMGAANYYGKYIDTKDQQAKYISETGTKDIQVISLNSYYEEFDRFDEKIDVLKLDCEGSEYIILSDPNFKPTPRQITVEFHEHAHKELHDKYFDSCMNNLLKYYVPVKHERTAQHGAGFNYWDSLFIRRNIL